jgi:hypothetical protein
MAERDSQVLLIKLIKEKIESTCYDYFFDKALDMLSNMKIDIFW